MYKSFGVQNFRGFHRLDVDGFERINLIAGKNNVGKTALLEAMFLHCGAYNPELAMKLDAFRGLRIVKVDLGQWSETPWNALFNALDVTKSIELEGTDTQTGHRSLRLTVMKDPSEIESVMRSVGYSEEPMSATPTPDEWKGLLSTAKETKVLELEYKENGRTGKCYMFLGVKGIGPRPFPPTPPFPAFFQGARTATSFKEDAELYSKLEIESKEEVVKDVLKIIEPRLVRLAMIIIAGEPILHGDVGFNRMLPLPVMGEGMVRLASLVTRISNARNGVVLIDEMENGLHYSILEKVWAAIAGVASQFNTQVFATTHSRECIMAAHRAFLGRGEYDFRLYRLDRREDMVKVVMYDQEALDAAIETGLEVR